MKIITKISGFFRNLIGIAAIAGCSSGTLHATVAWQQEYTGNQLVDGPSSPWQNLYTSGISPAPWSVAGTTMKWSAVDPASDFNFARIGRKSAGPASTWLDSTSGTLEFSLKVDSNPAEDIATSFMVNFLSGGMVWTLGIDKSTIKLGGSNVFDANNPVSYTDHSFDGSRFNLYRVVFEGGVARLYLNDAKTSILSYAGNASSSGAFLTLGDTGGAAQGAATLEFVRWTSEVATPVPEMTMGGYVIVALLFAGANCLRRRPRFSKTALN